MPQVASVHQSPVTSSSRTSLASAVFTRGWMNCIPTGDTVPGESVNGASTPAALPRLVPLKPERARPGTRVAWSTTTPAA
ncbi:hypothetical protein P405_21845 [Streptomyces sp. FR-008]|nr:hypothetical protein P405_21845 [Streptomyces sp. FR-008]